MPSLSQLVHAHPAAGWWTVIWLAGLLAAVLLGRRPDGRVLAAWALGTFSLVALAPPRGGPVAGIARTCDLALEHLHWPWEWARQDPRAGAILLLLLVGLSAARRPGWLAAGAAAPVVVEVVQYAVPSLARACSAPDVVHAWMGLTVGLGVGLLVRAAVRRARARAGASAGGPTPAVRVTRPVAALAAVSVLTLVLPAWALRETPAVATDATVALLGEDVVRQSAGDEPADGEDWLAADALDLPGTGTPFEEMARAALWDVQLVSGLLDREPGELTLPYAGPAQNWAYFWPRDGAFMAFALAGAGHADPAVEILTRVGDLHLDPMYGFDARYLLTGGRVSLDPRGAQVDGCGWVLWAIHETGGATRLPGEVHDLRDRCTDQLLRATGGGSHLPAPGQDYWEQTTYQHLLGASAPVAAGLRSAAADYLALGQDARAAQVQAAAYGVRSEIARFFGPDFQRAGGRGGLDAATAMLMPPFDPDPLPGVREAWLGYQELAARPGGGLAPGTDWKQDGISWTPEVALVAYTAAAAGELDLARRWLTWLDEHRAPWGSLPEKVDSQGRPGGPAPLGWTSALVLLTLEELSGEG